MHRRLRERLQCQPLLYVAEQPDHVTGSEALCAIRMRYHHAVAEETRDMQGGTGASVVVEWRAEIPLHAPVVEAVMFETGGCTCSVICPS